MSRSIKIVLFLLLIPFLAPKTCEQGGVVSKPAGKTAANQNKNPRVPDAKKGPRLKGHCGDNNLPSKRRVGGSDRLLCTEPAGNVSAPPISVVQSSQHDDAQHASIDHESVSQDTYGEDKTQNREEESTLTSKKSWWQKLSDRFRISKLKQARLSKLAEPA